MEKKQVRLQDVAAKAGVSITTVSHVINKTRYVKKETREYVLKVLDEMDYSIKKTKSRSIKFVGVLVADITEDYYISLIKTIETYASEQNISILVYDSEDDEEKEKRNIKAALGKDISGIIIAPINSEKCPKEIRETRIPVILVDRKYNGHNRTFVGINNFETGRVATKYLIEKGCKKIGFVGYADTVYTVKQRAVGYREFLRDKLPGTVPYILQLNYKKEDSTRLIREFMLQTQVDGLICATSDICYQVIGSLEELELPIPERVKLVTYDDNKWLDYLKYPVSVITQPTVEIGIYAIETLIHLIESPHETSKIATEVFLDTGFIDRL